MDACGHALEPCRVRFINVFILLKLFLNVLVTTGHAQACSHPLPAYVNADMPMTRPLLQTQLQLVLGGAVHRNCDVPQPVRARVEQSAIERFSRGSYDFSSELLQSAIAACAAVTAMPPPPPVYKLGLTR